MNGNSGNPGQGQNPNDERHFNYACELKRAGQNDYQIQSALQGQGLDEEAARRLVAYVNSVMPDSPPPQYNQTGAQQGGGGSSIPGWLIWILILVGINILSAIFEWDFWIY